MTTTNTATEYIKPRYTSKSMERAERELGWVGVVSNCTMGLLSYIGCDYEVAQDTGSKFVLQSTPIVQFDTTPTQSPTLLQNGR